MAKKRKTLERPPVPEAFIARMTEELGAGEAAMLAGALDATPSVSVRLNRRKTAGPLPEGLEPVPWCPSGFYLDERPDFIHDPLLHAGVYYVQEAASMIYEPIIADIAGGLKETEGNPLHVLDLCAAPGGKSTAMLNGLTAAGRERYFLVANEVDRRRAGILRENLDKWGDPNVAVTNSTADCFGRLEGFFDIVAVDAPCSGEGMMRREPEARRQWSEQLVEGCAALQRDILAHAVEAVRPGGWLVYSTCTFNRRENEDNVDWAVNALGLEPWGQSRRFMPHRERCEGLFVAVMRKPAVDGYTSRPRPVADMESLTSALGRAGVRILSAGTETQELKGNLATPSARSVLAHDYDRGRFPEVELSADDALAYLRRNALRLPDGTPEGYVAVTFRGHPIGLVKNLGNRANNLHPKEWRILT